MKFADIPSHPPRRYRTMSNLVRGDATQATVKVTLVS